MTANPGTSQAERWRTHADSLAMAQLALERKLEKDEQGVQELKAIVAYVAVVVDELRAEEARQPGKPGRPKLAKTSASFRQKVKILREERGWGRGRIARHMGVPESEVRRAFDDLAGEIPTARRVLK